MAGVLPGIGSLRAQASCAKIISILLLALGSTQSAPSSGSDLWTNPCSNHPVRHVRSTAEKELNFFITTLNKDMFKELNALYNKTNPIKVKGNCPRLNRLIEPISKAPNVMTAHQKFHISMMEFAEFLDKLKSMRIKTNVPFDFDKRNSIYEKTKNALRLTICEFNETIMTEFKLQPNARQTARIRCLPKEADLTRTQMLDMQFFKKLKKFFKQGKRILKKKKRNNKSGKVREGVLKRTKS